MRELKSFIPTRLEHTQESTALRQRHQIKKMSKPVGYNISGSAGSFFRPTSTIDFCNSSWNIYSNKASQSETAATVTQLVNHGVHEWPVIRRLIGAERGDFCKFSCLVLEEPSMDIRINEFLEST